jgi:hypothetical protein
MCHFLALSSFAIVELLAVHKAVTAYSMNRSIHPKRAQN